MNIDNKLILENSKKLNILYVEDDEQIQTSTRKLFLNFFASVDVAIDGQDGLEKYNKYLKENSNYYDLVENSNILTANLTDATELNAPIDIIDRLMENKEKISLIWINNARIQEILKSHMIDIEYFRKHYVVKVLDYFLGVIKGEYEVGNCPSIIEMLDFLNIKNCH